MVISNNCKKIAVAMIQSHTIHKRIAIVGEIRSRVDRVDYDTITFTVRPKDAPQVRAILSGGAAGGDIHKQYAPGVWIRMYGTLDEAKQVFKSNQVIIHPKAGF